MIDLKQNYEFIKTFGIIYVCANKKLKNKNIYRKSPKR